MHVLFVCAGNTCRSPMAKALFEAIAGERGKQHTADSAGLYAFEGMGASDNASQVLREHYDLDLSAHRTKKLTGGLAEKADLLVCMTQAQCSETKARFPKTNAVTMGAWADEPQDIADPYGGTLSEYLFCAKQMEVLLRKAVGRLP